MKNIQEDISETMRQTSLLIDDLSQITINIKKVLKGRETKLSSDDFMKAYGEGK